MKKAVQFGAGNIGRGFLAQLFNQSGYEVVFVELRPEMISCLNRNRQYTLKIVGKNPYEVLINNVSAISPSNAKAVREEISSADIVATAVGVNVLPKIAPLIASGIESRAERNIDKPLNIIVCENVLSAGKVLKRLIEKNISQSCLDYLDRHIGFVDTVVSRMIPPVPETMKKENTAFIVAEEYSILPVSAKTFAGEIPKIKGMVPYDNLEAYEHRKLFVHNLCHSICAYAGYRNHYVYIWETVQDNAIVSLARKAANESGQALIKKHGFNNRDIYGHIDNLIERFANKALGDTVCRVGRDPLRKLGLNDRLIGSARLCLDFDIIPFHIIKGIVHALHYDYEKDPQAKKLKTLLAENGIDYVLENICGLRKIGKLASMIKKRNYSGRLD